MGLLSQCTELGREMNAMKISSGVSDCVSAEIPQTFLVIINNHNNNYYYRLVYFLVFFFMVIYKMLMGTVICVVIYIIICWKIVLKFANT